jgi:hypothetical protein
MSQINTAYCAGLFEGEGSVHVVDYYYANGEKRARKTPQIKIQMSMTDLEPLERFQGTFGGRIQGPYMPRLATKPQWMVVIDSPTQAIKTLRAMYPFLSPRRQSKVDEVLAARAGESH